MIRGLEATQAYQNNLTVGSTDNKDHFADLRKLFERLRKYRLSMKPSKLQLFKAALHMFGFIVSEKGIQISEDRCQALRDLKPPKSKMEVRKILGMFQYFSRHIPKYNTISDPLSLITSPKQPFKWGKEQNEAFEQLKYLITHAPLLATPSWNEPFTLFTDSSDHAVGGVLCQNDRPVSFCNRLLTSGEGKLSTTLNECLRIVFCTKKLNHFLQNAQFIVKTDHKPLTSIVKEVHHENKRLQRY